MCSTCLLPYFLFTFISCGAFLYPSYTVASVSVNFLDSQAVTPEKSIVGLSLELCIFLSALTVRITCQFKTSIQYPFYFFLLFSMAAYQEISAVKCSYVAEHIVMMFILNTAFHPEMLLCIGWKARSLLQLYRQHYITTLTIYAK